MFSLLHQGVKRLKKKLKKYTTFDNVVIFPGTAEKLIGEAHEYVDNFQFHLANELFEEALKYTEFDELTLSVFAYSLYEVKSFERAKEVCEKLLSMGPTMYLEIMELYLTICMQLKNYKQVEQIITSLIEEGAIPPEQLEKFQRLKELNANIAENVEKDENLFHNHSVHDEVDFEQFQLDQFLSLPPNKQLNVIQEITSLNIRPIAQYLKEIVENDQTHPFIKSIILILLVEQEIDLSISICKFGKEIVVNPLTLQLPTKLPQFIEVSNIVVDKLEKDPSTLEMVEYLISKHAIVTYPFEWIDYEAGDIAIAYIDYVRTMFGVDQDMNNELLSFLQNLEKLTELQEV